MYHQHRGFTLLELIAVIVLIGILSVTLMSRVDSVNTASVQAGRDSLVAALFFAQQAAMARGTDIQLATAGSQISVTEAGNPLVGYPLILNGVTLTASNFSYDRLGRTTGADITLTNNAGVSARVTVEDSGYAHY